MTRNASAAAATVETVEPDRSGLIAVHIPPGARHPKIQMITRSQIHPDPEQPREDADDELRASIARQGMLEPIIVRPHPTIMMEYMIVNGERRWRGAEGVLEDLRCIIRTDLEDPVERLAVQLVANDGKPTPPLQEAKAFGRMIEASGMSAADLAELLGRAPSTVAERLALLELGPWLALIEAGELPMSHAVKVLLPLRAVPDTFHEKAITAIQADYRWRQKGAGRGISLGDFERLVNRYYRSAMYPLAKTKGYGKQPDFSTSKHDAECGCGIIKFDLTGTGAARACCGNPAWWGPLHRAAVKAKRPKGSKTQASKAAKKELYLPAGTKTLKSEYGATPKGAIALTDGNGQWCCAHGHDAQAFDPVDLDLSAIALVQWGGGSGQYPTVGTKDEKAVETARAKFVKRLDEAVASEAGRFALALEQKRNPYAVTGRGVAHALPYVIVDLALGAGAEDVIRDVAAAAEIKLPAGADLAAEYVEDIEKWTSKLAQDQAEDLLTGILTVRATGLKGPAAAREKTAEKMAARIRTQPVPWLTKPKAAPAPKPAARKTPAKAKPRTTATAAFMKDMYPSSALAAVIGNKAMPRTEVTKKLWSYIKRHQLQDQKHRRNINADDALLPIFGGRKAVSLFEMTKLVNKHLAGTAAAAALIGTSTKAKGKAKLAGVPFSKLSDQTAELPLADERKSGVTTCVVCACTDDRACDGGCGWLYSTDQGGKLRGVCSRCATGVNHAMQICNAALLAETHPNGATGRSARLLVDGAKDRRAQLNAMDAEAGDDEESGSRDGLTGGAGDGGDDLWDSTDDADELEEATG